MFYIQRIKDNYYFYYLANDNVSCNSKFREAIGFKDLDTAKVFKKYVEERTKDKYQIIEVVMTVSVVQEENKTEEIKIEEDN